MRVTLTRPPPPARGGAARPGRSSGGGPPETRKSQLLFDGRDIADLDIPDLPHLDQLPGTADDVPVTADLTLFGFGQDAASELYVLGRSQQKIPGGTLPLADGSTGVVLLIAPVDEEGG